MANLLLINGPNLNLVGTREPQLYGTTSLDEIETMVRARCETLGVELSWHQNNHEGELVELIQELPEKADGAVQTYFADLAPAERA